MAEEAESYIFTNISYSRARNELYTAEQRKVGDL